jgi:hypothetical protein
MLLLLQSAVSRHPVTVMQHCTQIAPFINTMHSVLVRYNIVLAYDIMGQNKKYQDDQEWQVMEMFLVPIFSSILLLPCEACEKN